MKFFVISLTVLLAFVNIGQIHAAQIVCTTYPVWLLTRATANNARNISLQLLTSPANGCAHDYTPSPQDLRKTLRRNTILIANGHLDDHIVLSVQKVNKNIRIITALADKNLDAHGFVSPCTAEIMIKKIAAELSKLDPENQSIYQKNCRKICEKLRRLQQHYQSLPGTRAVVLQNSVFINLARTGNYQPIVIRQDHNSILSAASLTRLQQQCRQKRPRMIWLEKDSRDPAAKALIKAFALQKVELDPMLTGPENPPLDYFIKVMQNNYQSIAGAAGK